MRTIINVIKGFMQAASQKDISAYAAGMAFFWVLSAVPFIAVLCAILSYTGVSGEALANLAVTVFPNATKAYLTQMFMDIQSYSIGILPTAIIVALWSASKGMLSLIRGLNNIHGTAECRSYFKLRLIASFYTVVLIFVIVFCLSVLVFGEQLGLVFHLSYVFAMLGLSLIFTLVYTYVPDVHRPMHKQFGAGIMAALGCTVFSYCFSVYVDNFNDFSSYGSISVIVIIMLWLYSTAYIILLGAYAGIYFTKEVPETYERMEMAER